MYWRKDPKVGGTFSGPPEWPRNGAILKGVEHHISGARWLEVQEFKANSSAAFEKTPGCWMPFDQVLCVRLRQCSSRPAPPANLPLTLAASSPFAQGGLLLHPSDSSL